MPPPAYQKIYMPAAGLYPAASGTGMNAGVYLNGYYWLAQPIIPPTNLVNIWKINAKSGQVVASTIFDNIEGAYPCSMATDGTLVYLTSGGSYLCSVKTIDPATFPAAMTKSGTVAALGNGWSPRGCVSPDGWLWFNYNGVRCVNTVPTADIATMVNIPGTSGDGREIHYDPVTGYVFAAVGAAFPRRIWRINPATKTIVDFYDAPDTLGSFCMGHGSLFVTYGGFPNFFLRRLNPATLATVATVALDWIGWPVADKDFVAVPVSAGGGARAGNVRIFDPDTNTTRQPGDMGPELDPFGAATGVSANILLGNTDNGGFLIGDITAPTVPTPRSGWGYLDVPLRRRSKHRGGELWGIIPEIAGYIG